MKNEARIDAQIEARRQDADFLERLRLRHEREASLYARLAGSSRSAS